MKEKIKKFLTKKSRWFLFLAVLYFVFPLDFIPDIVPGLGLGDDLLILLASLLINYKDHLIRKKEKEDNIIEGEIADK